jgi:hypothetical protein
VANALLAPLSALGQVLTHGTVAILANITAIVLSLPLLVVLGLVAVHSGSLGILPIGLALLVGILPNPASAGLQAIARGLAQREDPVLKEGWNGLRQLGMRALRCWLVSVLVTGVVIVNIVFYAGQRGLLAGILVTFWSVLLAVWLAMHLYIYPLLFVQENRKVFLTYRNALVLVASRPGVTLAVGPIWIVVLLVGAASGLATIIALTLAAAIQHNVFKGLLPTLRSSV